MAVIFTVSITENLQLADALTASGKQMTYELEVGDTQMLTWKVINDEEIPINLEFFATGDGSEFFIFEKFITMEPKQVREFEILVNIPSDHKDNVEYHTKLFALKKGSVESSGAHLVINVQMETHPVIKIGENPIYQSEVVKTAPIEKEISTPIVPEAKIVTEKEILETLEEKLERIKAANEAKSSQEIKVDETFEETLKEESVTDYVPEPEMDAEPVVEQAMDQKAEEEGGGCLIATAAFGSEMAPQVQLLREIRDNQLMNSNSGILFMSAFNQFYYSFSPYIADLERDSPIFKETVKITLTPMLTTLSVMEHADSEDSVIGLGIGVILLNLGMYVGLPTFGIVKLIQFRKK